MARAGGRGRTQGRPEGPFHPGLQPVHFHRRVDRKEQPFVQLVVETQEARHELRVGPLASERVAKADRLEADGQAMPDRQHEVETEPDEAGAAPSV